MTLSLPLAADSVIKVHEFPHDQEQTEKESEKVKEEFSMPYRSHFYVWEAEL